MEKLLGCVLGRPENPKRTTPNDDEDQKVEKLLQNWNPPKVPVSDIYHQLKGHTELEFFYKMFERKKPVYKIETVEKTVLIQDEYEELPLLGRDVIGKYRQWYHLFGGRYSYIHIGLIQVAVKPLTRNGSNSSVVICISDGRFLRFSDSMLALAESSLCDGPIYFNCYPCYMVPLEDHKIFNLKVLTSGFYGDGNSQDIAVVYRVYYKLASTCLIDPKEKVSFTRGNTTLMETNLLKDNVSVQRTISWDSVAVPATWEP